MPLTSISGTTSSPKRTMTLSSIRILQFYRGGSSPVHRVKTPILLRLILAAFVLPLSRSARRGVIVSSTCPSDRQKYCYYAQLLLGAAYEKGYVSRCYSRCPARHPLLYDLYEVTVGGCCKGVWPGPPFKKPRRASDRTRILCPREVVSGSVNGVSGLLAAMICCYSCWFIGVYCVYMSDLGGSECHSK